MTSQKKHPFASPAWVAYAAETLTELVAEHGVEGETFSASERFAEAPSEFADENGFASWYFSIDGKSVQVGVGQIDNPDLLIQSTWAIAIPNVKQVFTPELLAEWAKNPPQLPADPNLKIVGSMASAPAYLKQLHNRMAVVTE